jgi:hypothetical protein
MEAKRKKAENFPAKTTMAKRKKTKKFPARTTLSMSDELGERLARVAEAQKVSSMEAARLAVQQYVESSELAMKFPNRRSIEPARKIVNAAQQLSVNEYQDIVAKWRLDRTESQIDGIEHFDLKLDAWPAPVYLARVLSDLHTQFDEHDEFGVITNLGFWGDLSSGPLGTDSRGYLSAQERAVQRGMRLLRIFLIAEGNAKKALPQLRLHQKFAERCTKGFPNRVVLKYLTAPKSNFESVIEQVGHFACVRRRRQPAESLPSFDPDEGCLIVEPTYDRSGKMIKDLRLLFSRGPSHEDPNIQPYVDRLLQAEANARPLADLFKR